MKTKILFYTICAAMLCMILGSSTAFSTPSGNTFTSPTKGFSITFPSDWEMRKAFMGTEVAAIRPNVTPQERFGENVNVAVDDFKNPMTLDAYYQASMQGMGQYLHNFKVLAKGNTAINGQQALWIIYKHQYNGLDLKVLAYLLVGPKHGYVITCTSTPSRFEQWHSTFERIAGTFRLD